MKLTETKSGLLIPKEKESPKSLPKKYPFLEIQDENKRQQAKDALLILWEALSLGSNRCGGIVIPDNYERGDLHLNMYDFFAKTIIGESPHGESKC